MFASSCLLKSSTRRSTKGRAQLQSGSHGCDELICCNEAMECMVLAREREHSLFSRIICSVCLHIGPTARPNSGVRSQPLRTSFSARLRSVVHMAPIPMVSMLEPWSACRASTSLVLAAIRLKRGPPGGGRLGRDGRRRLVAGVLFARRWAERVGVACRARSRRNMRAARTHTNALALPYFFSLSRALSLCLCLCLCLALSAGAAGPLRFSAGTSSRRWTLWQRERREREASN
eukprot:scaffold124228_cov26-Tisochrysis_lutea.AAC.2